MNKGITLEELGDELDRQHNSKRDFISDTSALTVFADDEEFGIQLDIPKKKGPALIETFEMNRFMMGQVANHTKVPMSLVDILSNGTARERTQLAELLSVRLQDNPIKRMVRTMEHLSLIHI